MFIMFPLKDLVTQTLDLVQAQHSLVTNNTQNACNGPMKQNSKKIKITFTAK